MESFNLNNSSNSDNAQVIDANLDRAKEGLRVIEDWCRFNSKDRDLIIALKDLRQLLGIHHKNEYKFARETSSDQGIGLSHASQEKRLKSESILSANCSRVQEALRVIEEFSRASDPKLSKLAAKIRYEIYDLEIKILRSSIYLKRINKLYDSSICLVTSPKENLIETVSSALKAGVGMIQYRSKNQKDIEKLNQAIKVASICKEYDALFIVNDRIDIAIAAQADGVHLGQDDLPYKIARKLIGNEMIIGRSTHSKEQIALADKEGHDYLGVGPINFSLTKSNINPLGINFIQETENLTKLPWFAIGGINKENLPEIKSSGAKRIAVIGAIMNSVDPLKATEELIKALK